MQKNKLFCEGVCQRGAVLLRIVREEKFLASKFRHLGQGDSVPRLLWFFPESGSEDEVVEKHPDIPEEEPVK
jgi:hypothetical protein